MATRRHKKHKVGTARCAPLSRRLAQCAMADVADRLRTHAAAVALCAGGVARDTLRAQGRIREAAVAAVCFAGVLVPDLCKGFWFWSGSEPPVNNRECPAGGARRPGLRFADWFKARLACWRSLFQAAWGALHAEQVRRRGAPAQGVACGVFSDLLSPRRRAGGRQGHGGAVHLPATGAESASGPVPFRILPPIRNGLRIIRPGMMPQSVSGGMGAASMTWPASSPDS